MSKILPSGEVLFSIYDDVLTRSLNSVRIGRECGKYLLDTNNVFIGQKAGYYSKYTSECIYIGYNAGSNIVSGYRNIILGYDFNTDNINNIISIGYNNKTDSNSITIGNYNYGLGISNISLGFNNNLQGNNVIVLGKNNNIYNSIIFYHNLLYYNSNIINNDVINILGNNYNNLFYNNYSINYIYSNIFNTLNDKIYNKKIIKLKNINLAENSNSYIIHGIANVFYKNYNYNTNFTSNIILPPNSTYNLINKKSIVEIPISVVKRISRPYLDSENNVIFEQNGIILDNYKIFYYVSTPPSYGIFDNDIVSNINDLVYNNYQDYGQIFDKYGITPYIVIDNEYIKGIEKIIILQRTFGVINEYNTIINPKPNFSKEIEFIKYNTTVSLVGFDYVFIKDNILECINYEENDNLIFSIINVPKYGFISDIERNPIASFTLSNIDNIIYQNYNNINSDKCIINISYGYNFASISNITLNFNIINNNTVYLNDKYIYTNDITYNIVYDNVKNSDIPLLFLDNQDIIKINNDTSNIINLNVYFSFNKNNQIVNYGYTNLSETLDYNLYNNYYISSNLIVNEYYNKNIDYQFIRYDINENLIKDDFTITFNIYPNVLYSDLDSIYNFNVGFYYNDSNIICLNYNQNNYKLNNNEINNIIINNNYKNYNINNIRLEYYLSSNIISIYSDKIKLYNYFTNLIFTDFYIIKNFYDTNNYNIISGLNNEIKGLNNIVFGKNTIIAGDNSIVLGNDNSDNAIFESIIIGGSNFKQSFAQNAIVIGNNNISNLLFDNNISPIIIGNNINDNRFSLNIDNVICKYENNLFINTPTSIGYRSKDINDLNINDTSLNIRGGINLDSIEIANSSNYTISLNVNNTLTENVTYTLPILPSNITRVMLTTDINGNLYWNEIDTFTTNNIITDDIITKNIIATGTIIGDGHNIKNINLSDKTTDELKEGASNLYYTTKRINTAFDYNFSNLTTDALKEGSSNLYYTINRANSIFTCNLQKITSDDVAQGSNNLYFDYNFFSNVFIDNISNKTTDILKEGSNNLYYTYSRFVKQFNSNLKTINTDYLPEGNSNLYYTTKRENEKFILILNTISTDNIKEGSSNLYYTLSRINIDFQKFLSTKTTDNIPQGTSNLYYNVSNITNLVNSNLNLKTTDDVKEGTSNFYYTLARFNKYLSSNTTDNIKEGSSNFFFTKERFLNNLKTINSDFIKQGTSNFYFNNEILTQNFYSNLSNINLDFIYQGSSNTFIVNNTINNNLIVDGIINASNIIIQGCNLLDIYNTSINNLNSNYAKTLNNNYYTNEVIINSSNKLNFNLNIYNNQSLKFNRRGPPILVVGSNVGINNAIPRYNLDIYGITNSTYFRGDGSMLWNLDLSGNNLDQLKQGTSNLFISSNTYNNDLTILGTLYASNIFLLNGLSNIKIGGGCTGDLVNISNVNISNYSININVDFSSNNQGITINNSGPPFIVVDNKVGINNLLPRYNLDVKGYTFSDYFIGDGSMLWNLNLNNNNLDQILNGTSNFYITSNIYNNNLTIKGDLYTSNGIFDGDILPYETNTYSLGSTSSKWLDLYISSNININGVSLLSSNNVLEIINNNTQLPSSLLINELILINNKTCNYSTFSLREDGTLQFSTNNNDTLKSISYNDLNDRPFINFSNGIYNCNIVFLNDLIATNLSGYGSNIIGVNWSNLTNTSSIINSNIIKELLDFYISSNVLSEQNFINSNSINDIIYLYLSSNTLNLEGYVNSNHLSNINVNLGFDTVKDRNDAINSLTFISPLLRNSNIINLKYNPDVFVINEKEQLTFSPDIEIIDNIKTFKFQLKQGHLSYPDLWYYQINISDYSKTFLLDDYEYNIFNITSWSDKDLNAVYSSLVIITNQDNGIKRISANNIFGEAIELSDGLETMEGWQLDNDINYLTWFSTSYKTIYNILVDNINSTSNVTKITNKPNIINNGNNNTFNNCIGNVNNIFFNTNTYVNFNSNTNIFNIYGNYNITYLNGNSILLNNDLYYQNLNIEPSIWYKFDNNLTYDSGIYNNNLISIGNGGIYDNLVHKRGNGSVYFDNTNSYYNSSEVIIFGLPLSICFWFKTTGDNINLILYGGCISFDINNTLNVHITFINKTIILSSLNPINKGFWYYVVLTISNNNSSLYLNNIIQSEYNSEYDYIYENSIMNIKVGCTNTYIDDFRLYEIVINTDDIKKLYFNSSYYDNSYSLSYLNTNAWYKFDNDNELGYDFSGNNNLLYNSNCLYINGIKGKNSLYITNNATLFGNLNFNLYNTSFSICIWVYCFANDGIIFQLGNLIIKFLNNKWYFIFNNEITYTLLNYEEDICNWCHLVFTFTINNKIKNIYRNSQKINLVNFISSSPLDNSNNLTIGINWNGYIDDLRIYKEILLQNQIDILYTGTEIINNGIITNDSNKIINICNYTNLSWYNGFRTDYFNTGDGTKKFEILYSLFNNNTGSYNIYYDIYDNNDILISKNIQQIFINTINNHLSYSYSFILQNTIMPFGIYYIIIYTNCLTDNNDYLNINLTIY